MSIMQDYDSVKRAAEGAGSIQEIIRNLDLSPSGNTSKQLKKWMGIHNIDVPIYKPTGRNFNRVAVTDEVIFSYDSGYKLSGTNLLQRILKSKLKPFECATKECPVKGGHWLGKPISYDLDHIDGDRLNNRLNNLRLLCPNCHRQTDTWGSKNKRTINKKYCQCGKQIHKKSSTCYPCSVTTKIDWPSVDEILNKLKTKNYVQLGKELGVSDNTIKKHLKSLNVEPPKRR